LTVTREAAASVLEADPALARPEHQGLKILRERFTEHHDIDFSQIS